MAFGLASDNFIYLLSNTAACVECLGCDLILEALCRDHFAHLAPKLGLCASTCKLSTEVLNALRQNLREGPVVYFNIFRLMLRRYFSAL